MDLDIRGFANRIWIKNEKMINNQLFSEVFEKTGVLFHTKL